MKNNKNKKNSLVVLNSEGAILTLVKSGDSFIMLDQWQELVDGLNIAQIHDFVEGRRIITDSQGREWNFPTESEGMRVPMEKLFNFISDDYTINRDVLYSKYMDWVNEVCDACEWKSSFEPLEIVNALVTILEKNPDLITKK
jgi:hypothetical protein